MVVARNIPRLFPRTFLIILLVLAGCLVISTQTSPKAKATTGTTCQGINVPNLALASGQQAQYTVYGVLCTNPSYSTYTQSVTLMVAGGPNDHSYWDWPGPNNYYNGVSGYSATRYLAQAGFSTFNIDRIGVGLSSHPTSSQVTIPNDAYVLHELVGLLKTGAIGGVTFSNVVLAGYGEGSGMVLTEANTYQDVAGVITTGMLHKISQGGMTNIMHFIAANTDPSGDFASLDSGYLTTVPDTRYGLYYGPNSDPGTISYDEQTKQTVSSYENQTMSTALSSSSSNLITAPILTIIGQDDHLFCASDAVDCSSNTSVYNEEHPYYSSQAQLQVAVIPNAGHCLNLEMTAPQTFGTIESWLAALYPPAGASNPIANFSFESGLSGWTSTGSTSTSSTLVPTHYYAQLGAPTATNGDSSVSQTFTIPTGGTSLSFWYQVHCSDSVTNDWATATLTDNTSNTTNTVLPKTCANNTTWTRITANVTAGDSYTITLTNHDDNNPSNPTYTFFDDLDFQGTTTNPAVNPSFSAGNFSGWTATGTASVISTTLSGANFYAELGASTATNGDSSINQTFTAPSGASTLSFWYQVVCPDSVQYDWATATLYDNTTSTNSTILSPTCTNNAQWIPVTANVTAGDSYTLTLTNHDDNSAGDPTYTLFDNITFPGVAINPVANPDFQRGTFTGWTTAGTTSIGNDAPTDFAAQVGSTTFTNADSSISQTFTAPSGASTLSFWYLAVCPDGPTDSAQATLQDNTSNTTSTIVSDTCDPAPPPVVWWTQATASVTAGHSYTLTLISHEDSDGGTGVYVLFDGVTVR